ncbi:MAG: hypothetical protein L6W00_11060 [Lentisphaeria bacterium]|nr:MAG: hypothetical protein L6W00_11060 [Lentisphaeria bacterium]
MISSASTERMKSGISSRPRRSKSRSLRAEKVNDTNGARSSDASQVRRIESCGKWMIEWAGRSMNRPGASLNSLRTAPSRIRMNSG